MLQQRPLLPREQPQQVGLTDVILDLADAKIDLDEVLPRRVRNLLGPQSSTASTKVTGSSLVATKKKHTKRNLPNESLVTAVQWLMLLVPAGELQ